MATKYTSAVNIQGSSRRKYRGYVSATVSNVNNTTSRITWSARVEMYNAAQYGVGVQCSVGGTVRKTDTGYLSSSPGTKYKTVASVSGTTDYTRGTSAKNVTVTVKAYGTTVSGYGSAGGSTSASVTVSIPALPSYTVAYNANGGSGAPGSQTKWYGQTLTLSSTKPTRTGHTFKGWATSASGGIAYASGASYTSNAALTLYAVWEANTWPVTYDANGGDADSIPAAQTKTYGVTLVLSSTIPTRTNYNFLGWSTSSSAITPEYQAGGNYTADMAATLYAVWEVAYIEPIVTNISVDRCDSSGTYSDDGTYLTISFNYQLDTTYSGGMDYIQLAFKLSTATSYTNIYKFTPTDMSGAFSQVIGDGLVSTEFDYDIQIIVKDQKGNTTLTRSVAPLSYIIDFSPTGGIGIGEPAPEEKKLNIVIPTKMEQPLTANGITNNGNITNNGTIETNHIYLRNDQELAARLSSGDASSILRMNPSDQVELNWTSGGLKGRVFKKLWEGNWDGKTQISVPEIAYYNLIAVTGLISKYPDTVESTTRILIPRVNPTRFEGNTCYWGMHNLWFIWFGFNASSNALSTDNNAQDAMSILTVNYTNWAVGPLSGNITKIEGVL